MFPEEIGRDFRCLVHNGALNQSLTAVVSQSVAIMGCIIKAPKANTGVSRLQSVNGSAGNAATLAAGEGITLNISDLQKVQVAVPTVGDTLEIIYSLR